MKKYKLMVLSILISFSLLACSNSNTVVGNRNTTINIIATSNTSNTSNTSKYKWTNKTYISIGDSISWQDKQKYPDSKEIAKGYQSLLDEKIDFKNMTNYAIVGATMAKSSKYPNKASIMDSFLNENYTNSDIITIFAGTNDFKLNVPIGKIGNKKYDDSTFYGSYEKFLDHILKQNKSVKIYLFTPLQRDNSGYDINKINLAGAKLIDYVNAVKEIGRLYDLPVLDLYATSGMDSSNLKHYTRDGLHPNQDGYELITKPILEFIEKN